ncbi:PEBP family protein [Halorhabdus tiamatea SARL4B]|uniref:PEBP family protein n=1 Tax=Halorhabdus tiamatea SARL4B TaxID=1033806 RepID=F7PNS5_9EURY|nr:YbhB/YbcL family Raf kinase inhibitor-like protein [Halorhabdus tiamatea]ERJ06766.1 PEBP family protein [Halorhabdus tiamatea SARL4B]CCQ33689.1 PEBP family protein [Halorhabdus tiamatea SARL4B]
MVAFTLTSPAFDDGAPIPREYGYTERNVNPPLSVAGVPEDAASLAVVMDDPDALEPAGKIWDHWLVWNVPADVGTIPEGYDATETEATEGRNDFGEPGYGGPNPPDGRHTYRFVAYALDTTLSLGPGTTKDDFEAATEGHVLDEATLEGTYAP